MILIGIHLLCDFIACECYAASICYVTTNDFLKLLKKKISLHNSGLEDLKDEMGEVSNRKSSSTVIQKNKILACLYNSWKMLQSGMSDLLFERSSPGWKKEGNIFCDQQDWRQSPRFLEPELLVTNFRKKNEAGKVRGTVLTEAQNKSCHCKEI